MDPLIHEPVRLKILIMLIKHGELSFKELLDYVGTTEGNLSRHAQKLEEAGYIEIVKFFEGKRPKTLFRITEEGSKALKMYLDEIERMLKEIKNEG
ncbi:MAG: transcriptional regulator [Candidatus Hydrothermia bacterium]